MNINYSDRKHTPRFQTNIPAENSEFIRLAAKEMGFDMIVQQKAYGNYPRPGRISVWTNEPLSRDHGPFWQAYRRLVGAAETE